MIDALHISESGLKATQTWIDYISNNVANMQTVGFKKTSASFEDMIRTPGSNSIYSIGSQAPDYSNDALGMGARLSSPDLDFSEGSLKATYKPLDIAIKGAGFIEVMLEDGSLAYTRLGSLTTNLQGLLTTSSGYALSDEIEIPPDATSLRISKNGVVEAVFDDSTILELGQIHLARIPNASSLRPLGGGCYGLTEQNGDPIILSAGEDGMGEIQQGFLEMSNVDLVEEMTNLVLAQRAYQLNARVIQTVDQVLETVNNLRR